MIIRKLREVFIPKSENVTQEVTSSPIVDEDTTDYHLWIEDDIKSLEAPIHECGPSHFSHGYSPYGNIPPENRQTYIGVPAPAYLQDDPWFGPAFLSEKQQDYMQQEMEIKRQERESNFSIEPNDIHQRMYEIATQGTCTTLQLDPMPKLGGGSENFHEGWQSGTGMGQFR